jgi:DMSO/TMAO reductase YedYZ molybdopterin-dependent catalytic subunit
MRDDGDVSTQRSRGLHALAGLVAGLAGLAVSLLVTALLGIRAAPHVAVAEGVIETTPGGLAELLISIVGQYDKPLLVLGVTAALLGLSALAGLLAARSMLAANGIFVAMGAIGAVALWTRSGSSPYDVLPALAGAATWLLTLPLLLRPLAGPRPEGAAPGQPSLQDSGRRRFLALAGGVTVAAAVAGLGSRLAGQARRSVESTRRLLRLPVRSGVVPDGADLGVPGLEPWRSSNQDFYRIDTAIVVPSLDPNTWQLRIHGMVDQELVVTYQDLVDRELTEAWVTLCCVSNEVGGTLIGNAWWSGVRIADLLAEAGVQDGADAVLQTSHDGWSCGTPLAALTDDRDAMLAIAMNGEPLPVVHGFPVRMVVPGLYGFVSATKWLVDLEVTRFADFAAYWTERGWAEQAPVKTQSRIDRPRPGSSLPAGRQRIGGVAWAQHTGIAKVEYRLDGRPWQEATLGRVPGVDTWVQWAATVDLARGDHRLAVRATDLSGETQTAVERGVVPDGATGWHTVDFGAG